MKNTFALCTLLMISTSFTSSRDIEEIISRVGINFNLLSKPKQTYKKPLEDIKKDVISLQELGYRAEDIIEGIHKKCSFLTAPNKLILSKILSRNSK